MRPGFPRRISHSQVAGGRQAETGTGPSCGARQRLLLLFDSRFSRTAPLRVKLRIIMLYQTSRTCAGARLGRPLVGTHHSTPPTCAVICSCSRCRGRCLVVAATDIFNVLVLRSAPQHLASQPVVLSSSRPAIRGKRVAPITSVLMEPEVAETVAPQPTEAEQQQISTPVPVGGDPWEDTKWAGYKVQ
jgi:hypothetical protein